MISPDGITHVARFLADHPEGVLPGPVNGEELGTQFNFGEMVKRCEIFHEMSGELGDVSVKSDATGARKKKINKIE